MPHLINLVGLFMEKGPYHITPYHTITNTIPNHNMTIIITVKFTDIDKNIASAGMSYLYYQMWAFHSGQLATTQPTPQNNLKPLLLGWYYNQQ